MHTHKYIHILIHTYIHAFIHTHTQVNKHLIISDVVASTISCTDNDGSSPNNAITLSIQAAPAEFTLSGNDVVTTATATDYEVKASYKLVILAEDGGGTPKTGTATLYIQVGVVTER